MLPLTPLPPDRNIMASLLAMPVTKLLMQPGMQSYRLERACQPQPRALASKNEKFDTAMLCWSIAERLLLSPTTMSAVSLTASFFVWLTTLPAKAWRVLALATFLLVAGATEPRHAPHALSDVALSEGRMLRSARHRVDMSTIMPALG